MTIFDGPDVELLYPHEVSKPGAASLSRPPVAMKFLLEGQEIWERKAPVVDEHGQQVCEIAFDWRDKQIFRIQTAPYRNAEGTAEKPEERIYATDEAGDILPEHLTRQQARHQGQRYMIVTTLLFHGNKLLVQQRSPGKKIDPGKISASAHGVAKELFLADYRIENTQTAALLNSALELNEELRHATTPFTIRVWPGTREELLRYAKEEKLDDPETVYLVPEAYLPDDSYPLGKGEAKRSRAISSGFIFSKQPPQISIDPAELSDTRWQKMSDFVDDPNVTGDLQACTDALVDQYLKDSRDSGRLGTHLAKKALRKILGRDAA